MTVYTRMLKKYCVFSGSQSSEKIPGNTLFDSFVKAAKQLSGIGGDQNVKDPISLGIHSQLFLFEVR